MFLYSMVLTNYQRISINNFIEYSRFSTLENLSKL